VAEFHRMGIPAVGVDLSELLLQRAAGYAAEHGLPAAYVRGDLRALPFAGCFDAAANFFLSFGYLSDEENAASLAQIAQALRPGGRFLLDTWNAPQVIAAIQPKVVEEREDAVIIERSRYRPETRRVEWSNEVRFRDGERQRWWQSIRAYAPEELPPLFRAAGFERVELFGDWEGRGFAADSPRVLAVGRRRG
jgi:SAM-dependent methyltransferase